MSDVVDLTARLKVTYDKKSTQLTAKQITKDIQDGITNIDKESKKGSIAFKSFASIKKALEGIQKAGAEALKPIGSLIGKIGRIWLYRAIRASLKTISDALREGTSNLYQWSKAQNSILGNSFAKSMDSLATSILYFKNSLATVSAPLLETVSRWVDNITPKVISLVEAFSRFAAVLTGSDYVLKATKYNIAYANSVKAMTRQLMGFDELNVLNKKDTSGDITSYGNLFEEKPLDSSLKEKISQEVLGIGSILSAAPLVLGGILAFSGANVPLGIGLMAIGALTFANTLKADWEYLPEKLQVIVAAITEALSLAFIAIGGILVFSGANIPLGLGMLTAGFIGFAGLGKLDWDNVSTEVKNQIAIISSILSGAMAVIGAILCFTNPTVGIPLLVAGIGGLMFSSSISDSLDWNALKNILVKTFDNIGNWFKSTVLPWLEGKKWFKFGKDIISEFISGIKSMLSDLWGTIKGIGSTISSLFSSAVNGVKSLFGGGGLTNLFSGLGAKKYANGGTPDVGTLFWAGEAGAEVIAQVGGRSTVYNEQQLGSSLAYANEAVVNAILSSASSIMQSIAENKTEVNIGDREIARAASRGSKLTGNSLIQGA